MKRYKGWYIYHAPVGSSLWRATRYGVSLSGNSEEQLREMIDRRPDNEGRDHWVT